MCYPTWATHIPRDMGALSPTREHVFLVICVALPEKQICVFLFPKLRSFLICCPVSLEFCISTLDMPLLLYSLFFCLQVCLNLFFFSRSSCLSSELLKLWEIFSSRDYKFSFSVSHSWSNHLFCDSHLILLPLVAFSPASLHASTKVSLNNSDAVSMLSCLKAATNLAWNCLYQ